MITDKLLRQWRKDRDKAVRSLNVSTFKKMYYKYMRLGIYQLDPPDDYIIEITMHKMLYNLKDATDHEKRMAADWLKIHNCTTEI